MAFDWGGAGAGAATGWGMGSFGGPIGMGVGALLGGVAGGLFGGGDEEEQLRIISTLNPEQQRLLGQLAPYLQGQIGKGLPAWEGDLAAPIGAGEEWGIGKYKEAVEGMDPAAVRDWYMEYMAPAEQRYMKETVIPEVREAGVPGGTLRGTGTEGRVSGAWERFGEAQLGRIGEAVMGERAEARKMLPGYMGAAALPRLIEQMDLDKQIAEFVRTTPELNPILNLARDVLNIQTQAAYFPGQKESPFVTMAPAIGEMFAGIDWDKLKTSTPYKAT